jgi:hypothetical protein
MMHLTGNFTSNCFYPYSDGIEIMRMVVVVVLGLVLLSFLERRSKQVSLAQAPA